MRVELLTIPGLSFFQKTNRVIAGSQKATPAERQNQLSKNPASRVRYHRRNSLMHYISIMCHCIQETFPLWKNDGPRRRRTRAIQLPAIGALFLPDIDSLMLLFLPSIDFTHQALQWFYNGLAAMERIGGGNR